MKLKSNQHVTRITKLILICAALAASSMANLFTTYAQSPTETTDKDALITWTATGKQSGNVDVLFVQNAKGEHLRRENSSCKE